MLSVHRVVSTISFIALLGAVACGDPAGPVRRAGGPRADVALPQPTIPIYGMGAMRRATPQSPCSGGHARDFDFWVGDWAVSNRFGVVVAGSRIERALDGCVVIENWLPIAGTRGRSLNSWDATSGVWRQTWVPEQTSQGARPLRLAGGLLDPGTMRMSGVRHHWYYGFAYYDTITWTAPDADHVIQATTLDIPAFGVHSAGRPSYARTATLPPSHSPGTASCQPGGDAAETRNMDFTVGHWRVDAANGLSLGESEAALDLSGCLIEEKFATPKGYAAIGWLYYDPIENTYFRTYVDSEGNRVELRGGFEDGTLVLEGAEPVPGAEGARVRMTWSAVSTDQLQQSWEVAREGESWREVAKVVMTRE